MESPGKAQCRCWNYFFLSGRFEYFSKAEDSPAQNSLKLLTTAIIKTNSNYIFQINSGNTVYMFLTDNKITQYKKTKNNFHFLSFK